MGTADPRRRTLRMKPCDKSLSRYTAHVPTKCRRESLEVKRVVRGLVCFLSCNNSIKLPQHARLCCRIVLVGAYSRATFQRVRREARETRKLTLNKTLTIQGLVRKHGENI